MVVPPLTHEVIGRLFVDALTLVGLLEVAKFFCEKFVLATAKWVVGFVRRLLEIFGLEIRTSRKRKARKPKRRHARGRREVMMPPALDSPPPPRLAVAQDAERPAVKKDDDKPSEAA